MVVVIVVIVGAAVVVVIPLASIQFRLLVAQCHGAEHLHVVLAGVLHGILEK